MLYMLNNPTALLNSIFIIEEQFCVQYKHFLISKKRIAMIILLIQNNLAELLSEFAIPYLRIYNRALLFVGFFEHLSIVEEILYLESF